jgi:hypothetical protein
LTKPHLRALSKKETHNHICHIWENHLSVEKLTPSSEKETPVQVPSHMGERTLISSN